MKPERWQTIEELYHSASDLPDGQRETYLRDACHGDQALLEEVESLLQHGSGPEGFLDTQAIAIMAKAIAADEFHTSTPPLEGKILSHFRILEPIGRGGMGIVYAAEDLKLGRRVALKLLPGYLARDKESLRRFEREARAASALNHPNICTVYEIDEAAGVHFIAIELLEGETLKERMARSRLPTNEILRIGIEISEALDAAHSAGIVHRDIKPSNIFLTRRGPAKVLDFGIAKRIGPEPIEQSSTLSISLMGNSEADLTNTGALIGTTAYMSPEQVSVHTVDTRSDLFSLGAVLYEMTTGQMPFLGVDLSGVKLAIRQQQPIPAEQINPQARCGLNGIIQKALQKERLLRYQHAADLQADLRALQIRLEAKVARRRALLMPLVLIAAFAGLTTLFFHNTRVRPSHRAPVLTEKDTILLADFSNSTGDPVFDGTLRAGLSVQLEQSPFLSIITDQRIQQTLQMMGQKSDAKLTPNIARELCQRNGSAAVLDGSIVQIGTQYLLTLKAVNCENGESLASTEAPASDKNHVLDALGKVSEEIRTKLGESLSTTQRFDTPLEQATTHSLEALHAYSLGWKAMNGNGDDATAVPLFRRAISLDPNFAMAHAALGIALRNDVAETTKAYKLRERVSEREKFYIDSHYYTLVTGNLEKARQVYELWAVTYPRDWVPPNNLGNLCYALGQHEKGLEESLKAVSIDPTSSVSYANVASSLMALNRLDEAGAMAEEAPSKSLDSPALHYFLFELNFLKGNAEGMTKQVKWAAGKPGEEDQFLDLESGAAAYVGRLRDARDLSSRAVALAEQAGQKQSAADYEVMAALRNALLGRTIEARRQATGGLRLSTSWFPQAETALVLAFVDDGRALELTDEVAKRFPEHTVVQFVYRPMVRAQIALNRHDSSKAIQALQETTPYEFGAVALLYPAYIRGNAYLTAHQPSLAAAEFQKILDHRGIVRTDTIGALAHLGLARAYALEGDTVRSKAAYQDFLRLWKDADPDIPILKQAKTEYAKLQ